MIFNDLTKEYLDLKHDVDLNSSVVNNTNVLERNLYKIIESTLDLITDYNQQKLYETDDEEYSELMKLINLNLQQVIPWEGNSDPKGSFFLSTLSLLNKHHHCRICGKTINFFKEYDLYFLSLLIEFEYLVKLSKYEQIYKQTILKYWFVKFKVCLECDYLLIEIKNFNYIQDFNNKLGGFNENSGDDTDWILSKIDYVNNLKTVLLHLLGPKKPSLENVSKLHQYLKIMDEDIIYNLQLKLNLLIKEKISEETATNDKKILPDRNLNYQIKLIENTLKMINNFLVTKVKNKLPKEKQNIETNQSKETPMDKYQTKLKESERKEKLLAKEMELSNKLIIYKEQTLLLEEQLKVLISKRQFKDVKDLKNNMELLNKEINLIEKELIKVNEKL
ncbi:hypothetical protein HANVADRAFT_53590 [Hanseniaspora valbyensis NRRL Y-1626]|uniref:Uncharacterized protein n=1 Tax=Hanseniaspora valbyensis NRRL Y-1626 TaxID=766949 RepID=A0A1B7TAZ5_9ASCO|nr:hypothetical protein HANVADRAFT_53590 [Hanseniaspora valbyensis NRRL Y-1626]